MADYVNFARVRALPDFPLIDTVYFVQEYAGEPIRQFVVGDDGVPVEIAAATAADQLFGAGLIAAPTVEAMDSYFRQYAGQFPQYTTLALGVAGTAPGGFFTSNVSGTLHEYKRTTTSPFYIDRGLALGPDDVALGAYPTDPAALPVSDAALEVLATKVSTQDLADATGSALVGMPDGGNVSSLEGPERRIRALGLTANATSPNPTDVSASLTGLFAAADGAHQFPINYNIASASGGYQIGATTVLIPRTVGFSGFGLRSKIYTKPDTNIANLFAINTLGTGDWIVPFPGHMSVEYSGLYFDGRAAAANGKYPSAFEMGASAKFENLTLLGFAQGVRQINRYIDQVSVKRVTFTQEVGDSPFIDLFSAGDGCVLEQVHSSLKWDGSNPTTAVRSYAVRMRYKVGSRISEGLNGDQVLFGCDGIDVANMHIESGQVVFTGSSGTLRNSHMWPHISSAGNLDVPPVVINTIPGIGNLAPGVVSITDCAVVYQQGFLGGYSLSTPNLAIETAWVGHLHIERFYRKERMALATPALGLKTGAGIGDITFDNYSHFASVRSDQIQGKWHIADAMTADLPSAAGGLSLTSTLDGNHGVFQAASGTYYYKIVYLVDPIRGIGLVGANELVLSISSGGPAPLLVTEQQTRCMHRIYRGTASGMYDRYVDVPVIAGFRIPDFGSDVMGFPWKSRTAAPADPVNTGSVIAFEIKPASTDNTNTVAYGNVIAFGRSNLLVPTTGSWRSGDKYLFKNPPGNTYRRLLGYFRQTDGSNHVLNTDWVEIFENGRPNAASSSELISLSSAWNAQPLKRTGLRVYNPTLSQMMTASASLGSSPWVADAVEISASKIFDWANIAPLGVATTNVTVSGAVVGDVAKAAMSGGSGGLILFAEGTASGVVTVTAFNPTNSAIDLPSATLNVLVSRAGMVITPV